MSRKKGGPATNQAGEARSTYLSFAAGVKASLQLKGQTQPLLPSEPGMQPCAPPVLPKDSVEPFKGPTVFLWPQ